MGKITNLLIGLLIVSFVFTGFIVFMADTSIKTGEATLTPSEYNATYNKINEINSLSQDIQSSNQTVEQSASDILGSYFKQGYSAARLTLSSGSLATDMVSEAQTITGVTDGSNLFVPMISAIIVLIVIFSIILYAVIGREI